jgi:outer membrane lipoprotein-sorting protein
MAAVSWASLYQAAIEREDADYWYLRCTPRPGVNPPYARATLKVEKKRFLQMGIEYYDASGAKVKVWENRDVTDYRGVPRASIVELTDPRTGHKTILKVNDLRVNQGLKDSVFTMRELEWGS